MVASNSFGTVALNAARTARITASGRGAVTVAGRPACTLLGPSADLVRCGTSALSGADLAKPVDVYYTE